MAPDTVTALRVLPAGSPGDTPLHPSAPLSLLGLDGGWLIISGRVDLFGVAVEAGLPTGARHTLGQLSAGDLMLGMPADTAHTIVAVGRMDTKLQRLTHAALLDLPQEAGAALVERWLTRIAGIVFGESPPWPDIVAEPGDRLPLPAGARLHAPRGNAFWVLPNEGRLIGSGGSVNIPFDAGIVPIAAGLSVRAEATCQIALLSTAEALATGRDGGGLDRFHAVILAGIAEMEARAVVTAQTNLQERIAGNRRSMEWVLRGMADVAGARAPQPASTLGADQSTAAMLAVASAAGIDLPRRPRRIGGNESASDALARVNGIGLRRVLLRDDWWRRDNGPLLTNDSAPRAGQLFGGGGASPVALLPTGRDRYRLWDPADGRTVIVDAKVAATLSAEAMMLYRPLPERVEGALALLRFGCRGIHRELVRVVLLGVLSALVAAGVPIATGFLFESAVPRGETGQVAVVVVGLALAALGAAAFDLTKVVALVRVAGRIDASLQPALLHRVLGLPANFFRGFGTGDLTNRVLSIQTMRTLVAGDTIVSMLATVFAVTSLAVILIYSPLLALVAAALVALAGISTAGLSLGELRHERARAALRGLEDSFVVQALQGIIKLRVAAAETRLYAVWAALLARQKRSFFAGQRYAGYSEIFQEVFPLLATLALFLTAYQLLQAPAGEALTLGGFLAVNAAFGQLLAAVTALVRATTTALNVVPLVERLRPILATGPEAREEKNEATALTGRIELAHVMFRYVAGGRAALDDFSLTIEPGSFVALVGPSGSGKSSLLRLLLGFEAPESGDILYDGQSISSLDTVSLRRQIGVVLQHGSMTTGSILENITSGLPYALDEAWAAARLAGIDADIEAMPMGMHTMLMEGASTLSGGQRQRLLIARALIGKPSVLLFDEATSALDNRSQAMVTESLERLRTTRIVVAHRLSTIQRADRICVLEAGHLVETGTFDELIAQDGLFSRLARRQIL